MSDEQAPRRAADSGWVRVTPSCRIPRSELRFRVARSGGPGGQHANTSDTRVEVSFDVEASGALGPRQRERLLARLGPVVRAVASDTRSQARNREIALERLVARLADGLAVQAPRRPTRPSRAAQRDRVESKRRRGELKRSRGRRPTDDG
jgi:ribosome-associated protein